MAEQTKTTLFWGMTLDTKGFKKKLNQAKKNLTSAKKEIVASLGAIANAGKTVAIAGGAVGAGLALITKNAVEAINAQNILAQSIGSTQAEMAGLELATKKWGVETKMVMDKMKEKGGFENFKKLSDEVKGAGDAQAQLNKAIELFGNEGAKILPILQLGSKGLKEMEQEAFKLGMALDPKEVKKSVLAWGEFENTMLRFEGMAKKLGAQLSEPFARAFNSINTFLEVYQDDINSFFKSLGENINNLVKWGINVILINF